MVDLEGSDPPEGMGEDELRAEIARLESERVSLGEAYRSIHRGPGLVLIRLGKGGVLLIIAGTLGLIATLTVLTESWLVGIAGVVLLLVESIAVEASIEGWVEDHNAGVDERVRSLLAQQTPDDDWSSLKVDAAGAAPNPAAANKDGSRAD